MDVLVTAMTILVWSSVHKAYAVFMEIIMKSYAIVYLINILTWWYYSTITHVMNQLDLTICRLIEIYNTFCKAVSDGMEIRVVFLDISRAFDRVWHRKLLKN